MIASIFALAVQSFPVPGIVLFDRAVDSRVIDQCFAAKTVDDGKAVAKKYSLSFKNVNGVYVFTVGDPGGVESGEKATDFLETCLKKGVSKNDVLKLKEVCSNPKSEL